MTTENQKLIIALNMILLIISYFICVMFIYMFRNMNYESIVGAIISIPPCLLLAILRMKLAREYKLNFWI